MRAVDGDRLATKADLAEVLADLTRRLVLAMIVQMAIFTTLAAAEVRWLR